MSTPRTASSRRSATICDTPAISYHHGDLRNALMAEGRRQLNEVGPHDLSMRSLVRALGVSIAAPYQHFDDKEGLLVAIAVQGFQELAAERREVLARTNDPLLRVYRVMERYVRFAERERSLFKLMVDPQMLKRPHKELVQASAASFDLFANAVGEYGLSKGWPQDQLNLLVHAAWSVEHGLATLLLVKRATFPRRKVDLDEMVKFSLSLLLAGISSGPKQLNSIFDRISKLQALPG